MQLRTILLYLAVFLFALGLMACKQAEGEPCQTTSDCDEGLVCCYDGAGSPDSLGRCFAGTNCLPVDAGVDATTDATP